MLLLALPAGAQSGDNASEGPNYTVWNALAALAENTLEDPNATDDVLNAIRAEVVGMRTQFLTAQEAQQDRIAALREQIAALGPVPAEGQTEAPEITQRREELNRLLAERQAPLLAADEAFTRADAIIRAIDRELRTRQADALMQLGPTPANPANWLAGLNALISSALTLHGEAYNAWLDPARYQEMITDLPITIGALLLALLLLLRGRRWMETLTTRLLQSTTFLRGRVVAAFFVSLSQLAVPFAGLLLLSTAIQLTRMTGPTIEAIAQALVPAGMSVFFARWLSLHIFPIVQDPRLSLNMSDDDRRRARGNALVLAFLSGIETLFIPFLAPETQPPGALAVLVFPLVVLASLTIWRFTRVLRRHKPRRIERDGVEIDSSPFFDRMLRLGSRLLTVMALIAPVLGAAGYMAAAQHIVFPAISSLGLIGLVMVLHRLITAVYVTVVGDEERSAEGLVPALAGLMLSLMALAPLALIWGARETDLWEIWARFSEGVSLGETRISPTNILSFFVVFIAGYMITRALQGALGTSVLPKTSMEKGAQKAVVSGVGYVGITAAALVAFSWAGIDLSGLAIVAGALSVGIGFGLQNIVSNFVSGIILLIERPVSEGDWVEVGATSGTVERISVRSTVIQTFDRSKVIVPNADLISGAVTNYTKSSKTGRVIVPVGVAYGTDTRRVTRILQEIAESEPLVTVDPKPSVLFRGFGADSLNFEIRAILRDVNYMMAVASEMNHKIAARFAEEGIEIPFAQRDVWLRNPEALVAQPPREAAPAVPPVAAPLPQPDRDTDTAGESPDEPEHDFRPPTR
ncbi:MAG: mechanosensitive ion channel family protein [Rhodobacteraceae bacterium]|nr:mechanosensitive ion channel family protein [Paracoccaceae bacterium]